LSIADKENYLKELLIKDADFCLELCPKAFPTPFSDERNIIKVLKQNKKTLEKIVAAAGAIN